jgi:hypothetical protein
MVAVEFTERLEREVILGGQLAGEAKISDTVEV